ncbi:putative heat shock protein 101, partial [Toxoplasma gondii MAS]
VCGLSPLPRGLPRAEVELLALEKEKDPASQKRLAEVKEHLGEVADALRPLYLQYQQEKARIDELGKLAQKQDELKAKIERAQRVGDLDLVAELRFDALPGVEARFKKLQEEQEEYERTHKPLLTEVVGPEQIADVVHRWTNIPVQKLTQTETERFLTLGKSLAEQVIGQPQAVEAVTQAILRSAAGLSRRNRPIGSFLFLGPVRTVEETSEGACASSPPPSQSAARVLKMVSASQRGCEDARHIRQLRKAADAGPSPPRCPPRCPLDVVREVALDE